jgi:hypothetical protein
LNGGHVPGSDGGDTFVQSSAGLAETAVTLGDRHTLFGRLEIVGKPGHDLHVHDRPTTILPVNKLQGGYVRRFALPHATAGVGGSAWISAVPDALRARYYGRTAWGMSLFVVVRPPRHAM